MGTGMLFFQRKMSSVEGDYIPGARGFQGVGLVVRRIFELIHQDDRSVTIYPSPCNLSLSIAFVVFISGIFLYYFS